MKKLLFLAAFIIGISAGHDAAAQTAPVLMTASVDTIPDTSVGYLTKEVNGAVAQLGIHVKLTRVGSTTIGGTAYVEVSNDPTNIGWSRPDAVTYTITNSATQTKFFTIGDITAKYYRVRIENTEAGSIIPYGKLSVRSNK